MSTAIPSAPTLRVLRVFNGTDKGKGQIKILRLQRSVCLVMSLSVLEKVAQMLQAAAAGQGEVDSESLELLSEQLKVDPQLRTKARALLPLLVTIVHNSPTAVGSIPSTLVPKLLEDLKFAEVPQLIPAEAFKEGLQIPALQDLLVTVLKNVSADDMQGPARGLCQDALNLLTTTDTHAVGAIEQLAARLASFEALAPLIPWKELHDGTPELQTRLMALNVILAKHGTQVDPEYLSWPFSLDDVLWTATYIGYVNELLCATPAPDVRHVVILLSGTISSMCPVYKNGDETLLNGSIEDVLVTLAKTAQQDFAVLDARYHLIDASSVSLLARVPAEYLAEHHGPLVSGLPLNSTTVPAFCNCLTSMSTYKLLDMRSRQILALPVDMIVHIVYAVTRNEDTAWVFANTYPTVIETALQATSVPETADLQTSMELSLRMYKIPLPKSTPQVSAVPEN